MRSKPGPAFCPTSPGFQLGCQTSSESNLSTEDAEKFKEGLTSKDRPFQRPAFATSWQCHLGTWGWKPFQRGPRATCKKHKAFRPTERGGGLPPCGAPGSSGKTRLISDSTRVVSVNGQHHKPCWRGGMLTVMPSRSPSERFPETMRENTD